MVYLYNPIAASTVLCKQKTFNQTWHPVIGLGKFPVLGEMQEGGGEGGNGKKESRKMAESIEIFQCNTLVAELMPFFKVNNQAHHIRFFQEA